LYSWSVFASPMAAHLSERYGLSGSAVLTAASLSLVFTVANSVGPVTMISGGFFNDKMGPKWVVFLGGILFGAGLIASGFASSIGFLVVSYGLGCGLGMGLVYGCTINNSVKFFPDKRGLIGGIATATYGLSSVIIPPIANKLIVSMGVQNTFRIIGAVVMVVICGCAFFIEKCPDGYIPEGYVPREANSNSKKQNDRNWMEMIKDGNFYLMICMLMCGAFSGLMITSQASPMAQSIIKMSTAMAATCVSILALFNATGRVLAGFLSDRIGRVRTLFLAFCLSMAGLFLLYTCGEGSTLQFISAVAIIGLCFGSFMGVFPGFTADKFGAKNNSVNYGIMFIGFALAGFFGPTVVGKIVAATGSYRHAFLIAGMLAVAGIILCLLYTAVNKEEKMA
ncbi:MAG: transporter, family, oxalate/formate antiporter, partial [Clostridiales bacterium]|nr:transporter, family, oxalate/formate antiporter [Clostridiales bacterium]